MDMEPPIRSLSPAPERRTLPEVDIDPRRFRAVLGAYPTGVVAITALDGRSGKPLVFVAGSFSSVSLDPPLVCYWAGRGSSTQPAITQAGRFCVNVLAADQEDLCRRLASRAADRFAGVAWDISPLGNPLLAGCIAWIDCRIDSVTAYGDHDLVMGRVVDLDAVSQKTPLLFLRGAYGDYHAPADGLLQRFFDM